MAQFFVELKAHGDGTSMTDNIVTKCEPGKLYTRAYRSYKSAWWGSLMGWKPETADEYDQAFGDRAFGMTLGGG